MLRTYRLAPHKSRSAARVRASLDYDSLAPILLCAGTVGGAWFNEQLRLRTSASIDQTAEIDDSRAAQQSQQDAYEQLTALAQKRKQQIAQLQRDKQQMQQTAKKQSKAFQKLEGQLASTQQELAVVKQQHSVIAVELLQTKERLEQASKQLQVLQQRKAQLTSLLDNASSSSSIPASSSDTECDDDTQDAADGTRPKRIAVLGGKELKDSHRKMFAGCQIRHFGSMKDKGTGDMKRLEQCLKRGTIDEVYMLIRWNGHNETGRIASLCRRLNVPVFWLDAAQIVRAKGAAAEAEALSSNVSYGEAST